MQRTQNTSMAWMAGRLIGCLAMVVALAWPFAGFAQSVKPGLTLATCEHDTCACPATIDAHQSYTTADLTKKVSELQKQLWMQDLVQPKTLTPDSANSLNVDMRVQLKSWCVPKWMTVTPTDGSKTAQSFWANQLVELRTYGYCKKSGSAPCEDAELTWAIPGPSLRLKKASASTKTDGSSLALTLYNELTPYKKGDDPGPMTCNPAKGPVGRKGALLTPVSPSCFHGDNATNMHFHGSHVSPQPPGDFVLLTILGKGSDNCYSQSYAQQNTSKCSGGVMPMADTVIGSYDYQLNNIGWRQSEGTHWYHPHKHGSTAIQLINGMAGAFIVEGQFDETLNAFYQKDTGEELEEKLLVLQQISDVLPWGKAGGAAAPVLVNGQVNPVIRMRPGEIQRWRIISATQNQAAKLDFGFEDINSNCKNQKGDDLTVCPQMRQIAQDGVQFVWENFQQQPFLGSPAVTAKSDAAEGGEAFNQSSVGTTFLGLNPGNRADFLVKAPQKPGVLMLTHRASGAHHARVRRMIEARNQQLLQDAATTIKTLLEEKNLAADVPEANNPPLVTIIVEPCADGKEKCASINGMSFPTEKSEWPETPSYLNNLTNIDSKYNLLFSMAAPAANSGDTATVLAGGANNVSFWIAFGKDRDDVLRSDRFANQQFCATCVGAQMQLNQTQEWVVYNDSSVAHPFHIHINPFQLVEIGTRGGSSVVYDPPVWMDTLALPTGGLGKEGYARIRQTYLDYTGPYVLHCHVLGHEDRGMMSSLQTICPDHTDAAGKYGVVSTDGSADSCSAASSTSPLPVCSPNTDGKYASGPDAGGAYTPYCGNAQTTSH